MIEAIDPGGRVDKPPLRSLSYISRAVRPLGTVALGELLAKAQAYNQSTDVTGLLLHTATMFMQTVEGPAASIDLVFERIERDPQHHSLLVFFDAPIRQRVYPAWSMMCNGEIESAALNSFLLGRLGRAHELFTSEQANALSNTIEFVLDGVSAGWIAGAKPCR